MAKKAKKKTASKARNLNAKSTKPKTARKGAKRVSGAERPPKRPRKRKVPDVPGVTVSDQGLAIFLVDLAVSPSFRQAFNSDPAGTIAKAKNPMTAESQAVVLDAAKDPVEKHAILFTRLVLSNQSSGALFKALLKLKDEGGQD